MITTVQRWGNSQGLRLSKQILSGVDIRVGDRVEVTAREGEIVIRPVRHTRGRYDLEDLVRRIPKGYEAEEVEWGEPVGKELW